MINRYRKQSSERDYNTRKYSTIQEKSVAKTFSGKRTPNSGATTFIKGDVITDKFLLECKTRLTHCDSISIKKEWLEKLSSETLSSGKHNCALLFNFGPNEKNYVIIEENLFKDLIK